METLNLFHSTKLKQIINCSSVSRTTITLYESTDRRYLIEFIMEKIGKDTPHSIETTNEVFSDYFRAQYRFITSAMLFLS